MRNPYQVSHTHGLAIIRFRSPLHTESQLFSSPAGTEMFHFPAYTPTPAMYSPAGNRTQPRLGFPIRTPSDQRFVDNSPRLNAVSHVLHRLSMPRHPPYARNKTTITDKNRYKTPKHKQKIKRKMLASTLQFSHNTPPHTTHACNTHACSTWKPQGTKHITCCPRHPTAHQHTLACRKAQRAHHKSNQPMAAGVCPPGQFFQNKKGGSHSFDDSTTNPHHKTCGHTRNCGHKNK